MKRWYIILLAAAATVPVPATAVSLQVPFGGRTEVADLADYVATFYQYFVSVIGIIAVVIIMWGGLRWLTAGGSAEKVTKAKEMMFSAVIGVVIILLSYVFLATVNPELVRLRVPSVATIETESGTVIPGGSSCGEAQDRQHAIDKEVPYPRRNATVLNTLMTCIENHTTIPSGYSTPVRISDMIDPGNKWTYGVEYDSLNYTRGERECGEACPRGSCHTDFSCHYGGRTGHDGALAVDYNPRAGYTENQLKVAITEALGTDCRDAGGMPLGRLNSAEGDHSHVSSTTCSGL